MEHPSILSKLHDFRAADGLRFAHSGADFSKKKFT
jgi:hypothetical protein